MFSAYRHSTQAYIQVATETGVAGAKPVDLVIMLYEGAIDALTHALAHVKTADRAARGASIGRAIRIIDEGLKASLDDAGGDITQQLHSLYAYMTQRLLAAKLHDERQPAEEVRTLLKDLQACWLEISVRPAASLRAGAQPAPRAARCANQ